MTQRDFVRSYRHVEQRSNRKPLGLALLFAYLLGYAYAVITLAEGVFMLALQQHKALFFVASALLWIPLAAVLIIWTYRR